MSFRVIEKRDDGTTIAILDNKTEFASKNESTNNKKALKENIKSDQYQTIHNNKFFKKIENDKKNLIIKPNQKDSKPKNSPEKQSNHTLHIEPIVRNSNSKTNILQIEQTSKKLNNMKEIQLNKESEKNQMTVNLNELKAKPSIIEPNKTQININLNKQKTEQAFKNPSNLPTIQPTNNSNQIHNLEEVPKKLTEIKTEQTFNKHDETQCNFLPTIHLFKYLNKSQKTIDTNKDQTNKDQTNKDQTNKDQTNKDQTNKDQTISDEKKLNSSFSVRTIPKNVNPRFNFYSSYSYARRKLLPPQLISQENKITLVLDLDETLVHSVFCPISHCDFSFRTESLHHISVCLRPGAKDFIQQVGEFYELVLFTVGNRVYADKIIDFIDPQKMIKYRLYRESCTYSNGNFIKDLSRLGRDLNKVIILDDSPYSYKLQPKNALPISSWVDDPNDKELVRIQSFLIENHDADNVYDILHEYRMKSLPSRHSKRKKNNSKKKKCVE